MIPTCEKPAAECPPHWHEGICGACGAPISWHLGGTNDVYKGKDPDAFRKAVHKGFFE